MPLLICVTAKTLDAEGRREPHRDVRHRRGRDGAGASGARAGLATHQMGGFDRDAFREAFSMPEDVEIIAMIAIGHHGDASQLDETLREREAAPRARKTLGGNGVRRRVGQGVQVSANASMLVRRAKADAPHPPATCAPPRRPRFPRRPPPRSSAPSRSDSPRTRRRARAYRSDCPKSVGPMMPPSAVPNA